MLKRGWAAVALLGGLWLSSALAATPANEVKSMVQAGHMAQAYAYGVKHEEAFGQPVFDFFFGIAAVNTGHAGEGVMALERYVLRYPKNVSARMQLARGYFMLGADARAREEFRALRKLSPPPKVAATIDRYLDAIRLRETRYSLSKGVYVEAGIGTDSNVNGGVSAATVTLPFANYGELSGPVLQQYRKQSDTFTMFGAGGYVSNPVAPGVALYGNGALSLQNNNKSSNHKWNVDSYNVGGGVSVLREKNLYRVGLALGQIDRGNDRLLSTTGGLLQWQHQLSELRSVSLGLQAARLDYGSGDSAFNADFVGVSAGYRQLFSAAWQPILSLGLMAGHQHSRTGRSELVPDTRGLSAGVSFTPAPKWGASLAYTYQESDYQGTWPALTVVRHDRYQSVEAAVSYLLTRRWSLRGELTSIRNHSNIEIYTFPRDIALFKVRYEFN